MTNETKANEAPAPEAAEPAAEAPRTAPALPESWTPRTTLGRKVASGEITSLDEIYDSGRRVLEPEIIDVLLPDLADEVMEIESTQRMTPSGRKMKMKAVVVLGNGRGYVAAGLGKAPEAKDAIGKAIQNAKKRVVRVRLGCGSWECGCGTPHSVAQEVFGKSGTAVIRLKPAPRGVGLVAGETTKKVLQLAGVKDAWTFATGRTRNTQNTVLATIAALDKLNRLKRGRRAKEAQAA